MLTSNRMTERWSGDIIVKSGLLAPLVLGRGCSLKTSPSDGGMARMIRSRTALCRSLTMRIGYACDTNFNDCARAVAGVNEVNCLGMLGCGMWGQLLIGL